jgi:hypothetical protein
MRLAKNSWPALCSDTEQLLDELHLRYPVALCSSRAVAFRNGIGFPDRASYIPTAAAFAPEPSRVRPGPRYPRGPCFETWLTEAP